MTDRKLIQTDEHGVWLHRNLAIALTVITLLTIFITLAVSATEVKIQVNYQAEKIKEIDAKVNQNIIATNDINIKLSSIETKIDYIIESKEG